VNSRERAYAALEGRPSDRSPVTVLYSRLYHEDHFHELTGLPGWQFDVWANGSAEAYLRLYLTMIGQAPLELLQPHAAPTRAWRERTELVELDCRRFWRDRRDGSLTAVPDPVSGHAKDDQAHQTCIVFDRHDVDEKVRVITAEAQIASGVNDYVDAVVAACGNEHFVISGGVVGTVYRCSQYVGLTNTFYLMAERPDLIDYLCRRLLEQNIERIRTLAACRGDAIYIDDATATSDMISPRHYERFSLPYMRAMVDEIHRLGHKAIIIYFGGIADRLDQIASIGADGLSMETSMKGYVNDVGDICRRIGRRVTIFGNVDPIRFLQDGSDGELEAEMRRQAEAGREARGFVMCTGSPITPSTPLSRVQRFVELGRTIGSRGGGQ
jgi:uroporphyrinogen-III decarboxylase